MFKKKPEEKKPVEKVEQEEEEEVVEKDCPNADVALTLIRDAVRDYIMPICNIDKQRKSDIGVCLEYLGEYIKSNKEIEVVVKHIDDGNLVQYSNVFKRNGYIIKVDINKAEK